MSANPTKLDVSQSQVARLQESQNQLKEMIAEKDQTIAQLRKDCTYYEKVILALSRSKITADQLAQWLREEPEEGMTFADVVAELECPQNAS